MSVSMFVALRFPAIPLQIHGWRRILRGGGRVRTVRLEKSFHSRSRTVKCWNDEMTPVRRVICFREA